MDLLALFKNRAWSRSRNKNDAYLEDINVVIDKLNEVITASNNTGALYGELTTGPLSEGSTYRILLTNVYGLPMTFPNASYVLAAIDPLTGQQYGGIQELVPSDVTGIYNPSNAIRLQVAEDIPGGLIIRYFGK